MCVMLLLHLLCCYYTDLLCVLSWNITLTSYVCYRFITLAYHVFNYITLTDYVCYCVITLAD